MHKQPGDRQATDRTWASALVLEHSLLDAVCDAQGSAILVVDSDDIIVYASPQLLNFFEIPEFYLQAGTRLRDCLGAIYDHCIRAILSPNPPSREEWLAERVASHWRERFETLDRTVKKRTVRQLNRRLANGFGICAISDITEQKKREEQWRIDLERVEVTENILDSLPQPVMVWDRQHIVVGINKAFVAMMGTSEDAILGRPAADLLESRFLASLQQAEQQVGVRERFIRIADPGSQQASPAAYINRIGKTDRSFCVVTFASVDGAAHLLRPTIRAESRNAPGPAAHITSPLSPPQQQPHPATEPPREDSLRQRVLIASSDPIFLANAVGVLPQQASDRCIVHSPYELRAVIELARSMAMSIDLIITDRAMSVSREQLALDDTTRTLVADRNSVAERLTQHLQPRAATSARTGSHPAGIVRAPKKTVEILVVEDNEVNQIVFSQILEGLGRSYKLAVNGADALAIWQAERPPIVLMDISLPDINGMDLCRLMRQRQRPGDPRSAIIGVLVPAFDHDRGRCLDAGMDDVIVKPLSPDMIEQLLDRHLETSRHATA
ncbi:response regulator [Agrobacterium vitis]|uniref:response regulator n=1 Tax=Agrobacterium vitis TaxID=373 RepID=UPI0012E7D73C|nr:response regulator [Agrobacterium vitis]MUZ61435.1 response regulator [Agrobacterium vitis]